MCYLTLLLDRWLQAAESNSPYLKKIFQGIPWVSGFFFADHFVWNLFGSRKRSRVHWGFGGIFFLLGIAYVSGPCGIFFVLRVWFAHRGFGYDFGFLVFWILDLGVWILEFDFGPQPYGWVLLALGVLRALTPPRGVEGEPRGWSSS